MVRIQGRYAEAQALLTEALLDLERTSGRDSLDAGRAATALAALYAASARPVEAEILASRAWRVFERDPGATESDRSDAVVLLASVYFERRRNAAAEGLLSDLLGQRREPLCVPRLQRPRGASHPPGRPRYRRVPARPGTGDGPPGAAGRTTRCGPRRSTTWRRCAASSSATSRRSSTTGRRWRFGKRPSDRSHPDTARGMLNLAALHHERGREKLAEDLYRRAAAVFAAAYGDEHELTLIARAELAEVLRAERRYTESKGLSASIVPALETRLGAEDPRVVRAVENYRRLLHRSRPLTEAHPPQHSLEPGLAAEIVVDGMRVRRDQREGALLAPPARARSTTPPARRARGGQSRSRCREHTGRRRAGAGPPAPPGPPRVWPDRARISPVAARMLFMSPAMARPFSSIAERLAGSRPSAHTRGPCSYRPCRTTDRTPGPCGSSGALPRIRAS